VENHRKKFIKWKNLVKCNQEFVKVEPISGSIDQSQTKGLVFLVIGRGIVNFTN
jgi:hypothetical protein